MADKTIELTYVPHPSMPSNMPGSWPIPGWGAVSILPGENKKVHIKVAEALLGRCTDVRLVDDHDYTRLSNDWAKRFPAQFEKLKAKSDELKAKHAETVAKKTKKDGDK